LRGGIKNYESCYYQIDKKQKMYYNRSTKYKCLLDGGGFMAKEATLQVRMDADLKEQAEALYKKMGTSFAEAVRIFAKQSVQENAMPFVVHVPESKPARKLGIANGQYNIPDDIDECNDEIAQMFGEDL
jgi:DNA-damage-inducible protein J